MVEMVSLKEPSAGVRLGKAQQRFLEALRTAGGRSTLTAVRQQAAISRESLQSLAEHQLIELTMEPEGKPAAAFISEESLNEDERPVLNGEQLKAFKAVKAAFGTYKEFLLFGITGSGKTEVYMRLIEEALTEGKQSLLMVPEISLTPQLVSVFTKRFGDRVGFTHSRMTDRERDRIWRLSRQGAFDIIIGPRSALFTPLKKLGLIILDEEHEPTYRQEQMAPHYHAREVAAMLCEEKSIPLLLGSATPSLETFYRAETGEVELLKLTQRAVHNARLPKVRLVDMRVRTRLGKMGIFCDELMEGIGRRLQVGEQSILFLNRKGYATFVNCRNCGFVLKCPRCNMPYTYHKEVNLLICHHCGKEAGLPSVCPECGSKHLMQFGLGTEKVEEEARRLFPTARIMRMDMSTTKSREDYENVYQTFRDGEGDILIGTQMVAKGFDFPKVTLVGVLAADMTLYNADYHSPERTFQLLTQVSGRSGRGEKEGQVIIQTFSPEHYCLQMAARQDYEGFYENEITARKLMECPPFTHLGQVIVTGRNEERVVKLTKLLGQWMRVYAKGRQIEVLGPSPASIYRINNVFRRKLIIKCKEEDRLRNFMDYCVKGFTKRVAESKGQEGVEPSLLNGTTIICDLDPMQII